VRLSTTRARIDAITSEFGAAVSVRPRVPR
jgi:hypothetical protein